MVGVKMDYEKMTKTELIGEINSLKSTLKEAERKRSKHELAEYVERFQRLAELSITLSGDPIDIFKRVAEMIGKLFGIPIVCLSEIRGDTLCFLSVYNKGKVLVDAGQCPISITPCSTVKDSKDMRIYQNVMEKFPKASFLKMHNAFSYCGFPSLDSEGNVISVTCLLDDKPHEYSSEDKDLLQIFAQRIGIEMERKKFITERKRVENALSQSREQIQSILDNATAVIYLKDTQGTYILINRQYQNIFHVTKEEIVGKTDYDIFPKEMADAFQANDRKVLKAQAPLEMEEVALRDDGPHTYISIKFPLFDSNGIAYGVCGISTDITERKRAEKMLLESSEEKYRILANSTKAISWICDVSTWQFTFVGAYAETLLGYRIEEWYQENFWQNHIHPDDREQTINYCVTSTQRLEDHEFEYRMIASDGQIIWIYDIAKVTHSKGEPIQLHGFMIDITERKRMEEELRILNESLEQRVTERTAELSKVNEKLLIEITERKKAEEMLQERKKALEQKNIALSEVLGQIEIEKKQIKDNVIINAETLLLPIIQKLKLTGESRKYVQLLRKNLQELTSSFGTRLTEKGAKLTSREIEICNMIKNGLANKEIASLLNISLRTAEKHRINIRKKLGIVNKDINLASFLKTL